MAPVHETTTETVETTDPSGPSRPGGQVVAVRVLRHVVLPILVTALLAVVVSRGVELIHVQTEPWMEPDERWESLPPQLLTLAALVTWPFVALLFAVTGSMWATAILSLAAGAVIGFADYQKMSQRGEPLFPTDVEYLSDAGMLFSTTGVSPVVAVLLVLLVLGGLTAVVVVAWRRRRPRARAERWLRWGLRGALAVAGVAGIVVISGFNTSGNPLRQAYEDIPITWAEWNQVQNYAQNGFVAGALYNLPTAAMERPADYSEERMAELAQTYTELAQQANNSRQAGVLDDANVVVILGESFTDPTRLEGVEAAEDPIPFTRSLMAETTSGTMLSSGYGGGTANVEFEVLTSMALANFQPQMHAPYPMLVPHHERFPSIVDRLSDDHEALAIHPYSPGFYRRETVYPILGFDRATFWDTIGHRDKIEDDDHISDAATYTELLDELRATAAPMIANVVTMQNHSPYDGLFSDPIEVTGELSDSQAETAGHYLRGLRHSDDAMAGLISELEELDEKTIVLFYGDHLPAMWPDAVEDRNDEQTLHETPWFVWANFDTTEVEPPEVLGPNYLAGQLLDTANAPLTPFDALLAELSGELAADQAGRMLDAQGAPITAETLSARGQELLEDYRLVQYDLAVGQRFAMDSMLEVP